MSPCPTPDPISAETSKRRAGERSGEGADSVRRYLEDLRKQHPKADRRDSDGQSTINTLLANDVIRLKGEGHTYRVVSVERSASGADARCRVSLVCAETGGAVMLVRGGRDVVRVLARAKR